MYAASEDEIFCKEHDAEIVSIADRIFTYSQNSKCRDEARRLLFRHYCDTNRKPEAKIIAEDMPSIETCYERNIYWMLEGEACPAHLHERILDDLRYLTWDIWAYSVHANMLPDDKQKLETLYKQIECLVKENFPDKE